MSRAGSGLMGKKIHLENHVTFLWSNNAASHVLGILEEGNKNTENPICE